MNIQIQPLPEQMTSWIENHVPEKDLFFLREEDLKTFESDFSGTLIMPRAEFSKHTSYNGIQWVNSYETWNISKEAHFVLVAKPDWITSLAHSKKKTLFHIQHKMGRGLIFPISYLTETEALPEDYIIRESEKQFVIIQKEMWLRLPGSYKEEIIVTNAQQYDEWTSTKSPVALPTHLKKYANTFSTKPGANYLAATLYAISSNPEKDEWIVHEWVHGGTFAQGLKNASYSITKDDFREADIVVWVDKEETIQHAAYCIDNHFFFNKNGQTFFNPWKVVHWDELNKEWGKYRTRVYRKLSNE